MFSGRFLCSHNLQDNYFPPCFSTSTLPLGFQRHPDTECSLIVSFVKTVMCICIRAHVRPRYPQVNMRVSCMLCGDSDLQGQRQLRSPGSPSRVGGCGGPRPAGQHAQASEAPALVLRPLSSQATEGMWRPFTEVGSELASKSRRTPQDSSSPSGERGRGAPLNPTRFQQPFGRSWGSDLCVCLCASQNPVPPDLLTHTDETQQSCSRPAPWVSAWPFNTCTAHLWARGGQITCRHSPIPSTDS